MLWERLVWEVVVVMLGLLGLFCFFVLGLFGFVGFSGVVLFFCVVFCSCDGDCWVDCFGKGLMVVFEGFSVFI